MAPVEHEVGRDMDQPHLPLGTCLGEIDDAGGVDPKRLRFLAFGAVDRRISGGIDHDVGGDAFDLAAQRRGVADVELRARESARLDLRRNRGKQGLAQLPAGPGNQRSHG